MVFNPAAWGVDPQKLEEARRITRRIRAEVRVGKGERWEGRFQVILHTNDGDLEAKEFARKMVEQFTSDMANHLYVWFEMPGERYYVV